MLIIDCLLYINIKLERIINIIFILNYFLIIYNKSFNQTHIIFIVYSARKHQ